jgi:hypothetical protein
MRRSRRSRKMDELIAHFEAEDRAVKYLDELSSKEVALATALSAELLLAIRWEEEQREMIRRGDPREVVRITPDDMRKLHAALAAILPGAIDGAAQQRVIGVLAGLPPDRAWRIAHKVAKWAEFENRLHDRSHDHE